MGDLEPVYDRFPITSEFDLTRDCDTDMYLASLWNKAHNFFVRHVVLPFDAKNGAQAALVKPLQ